MGTNLTRSSSDPSCRIRGGFFKKIGGIFKKKPASGVTHFNLFNRKPKKSKKNNNNQLGLIASPRYFNFEDHYSEQSLKKVGYKKKK